MPIQFRSSAILALALVTPLGVAACSKGGGKAASGSGTAATAAGAGGAGAVADNGPGQVISIDQLPKPKAGLWETVSADRDGTKDTFRHCQTGEAITAADMAKMGKDCQKMIVRRNLLGTVTMDMSCKSPRFSMTAHTTAHGDFTSHMVSDTTMTMAIEGQPPRTMQTHREARYVGPCTGKDDG